MRVLWFGFKLLVVLVIVLFVWQTWQCWFPPAPISSHDPFRFGYPDSPQKPEELKRAEEIILENWTSVRKWKRKRLDNDTYVEARMAKLSRSSRSRNIYFRSEAELRKFTELSIVLDLFIAALRQHDRMNGTSLLSQCREPIGLYLTDDYVRDALGIRDYNIRRPGDREILEAAGVHIEDDSL